MNTLDAIRARRSIRKYTSQSVSLDTIHQLLEAGMCAPSTHNKKSAEFIVIQDRATLNCFAEYGKYHKMLKEASCAILVCGNTEKMSVHDFVINNIQYINFSNPLETYPNSDIIVVGVK